MIFGLKGIAHDLAFLSNDDVETPSSMMGKKMVPILELGRPGSEDHEVRLRGFCSVAGYKNWALHSRSRIAMGCLDG